MAESIEATDLAARLRRLADELVAVGEDMVEAGGYGGCMAERGGELVGAGLMVREWVAAIDGLVIIDLASPVQMRKTLELVDVLKRAGVLFVPVPVLSEDEFRAQLAEVERRLSEIEGMAK
jgi:hypothetical protein